MLPAPPAASLSVYLAFPSLRGTGKKVMDTLIHTPHDLGHTDSGSKGLLPEGGLEARKTRKPLLVFRLSVLFLLRADARANNELLFHEPPRNTRHAYCPLPATEDTPEIPRRQNAAHFPLTPALSLRLSQNPEIPLVPPFAKGETSR